MKIIISILGLFLGVVLFFRFPDLDIRILGIGAHRNFLFHSFFITIVLLFLSRFFKRRSFISLFLDSILFGAGLGIVSHLFIDGFQSHPVRFPFIGSIVNGTSIDDRIWLFANSLACIFVSIRIYLKNKNCLLKHHHQSL